MAKKPKYLFDEDGIRYLEREIECCKQPECQHYEIEQASQTGKCICCNIPLAKVARRIYIPF